MSSTTDEQQLIGFFTPPAGTDEEVPAVVATNANHRNDASSGDEQQPLQTQTQQQQTQQPQQRNKKTLRYTQSGQVVDSSHSYYDDESKTERNLAYKEIPRLIPRNRAFNQSENVVRVFHNHRWRVFFLLRHDWFHAALRFPTVVSVFFLLSTWTIMIVLWAALYYAIDSKDPLVECGLGVSGSPISFAGAFAFSLETCTTVGYTLPYGVNAFFEGNCPELIISIYFQMMWSMMFNAFLFAFFYNRLGRSEARGAQVVMSNKAIVNISHGGQVRLQVRIFDVDASHPVVEAHVRLYVVNKNRPVPRPLRLLQPNDEFGATLILSLPTVVTHHMDVYSILHPPSEHQPIHHCGLVLRQVDSYTNNREEYNCPICGESYGTYDRWIRHARYQRLIESKENYPVQGSHLSLTEDDLLPPPAPITDFQELREYFSRELSEVVCVVEGIDPLTSGTFQALQSYRFNDIIWDEHTQFAPCLTIDAKQSFVVDLDKFHDTMRIEPHPKSDVRSTKSSAIIAPSCTYPHPSMNSNNKNNGSSDDGDYVGDIIASLVGGGTNNSNTNSGRQKQRSANVQDSLIRALEKN